MLPCAAVAPVVDIDAGGVFNCTSAALKELKKAYQGRAAPKRRSRAGQLKKAGAGMGRM
eukprot:gene2289-6582_t